MADDAARCMRALLAVAVDRRRIFCRAGCVDSRSDGVSATLGAAADGQRDVAVRPLNSIASKLCSHRSKRLFLWEQGLPAMKAMNSSRNRVAYVASKLCSHRFWGYSDSRHPARSFPNF